VLSTPGMISMMEGAAATLLGAHLPPDKATVGFAVCIKHVAGAPRCAKCTATAALREVVEGRKFLFNVEIRDGEADDRDRHP
jgi:fluoroacetyl-CoA thioesterase